MPAQELSMSDHMSSLEPVTRDGNSGGSRFAPGTRSVSDAAGIDGIARKVGQNRATAKACGTLGEALCAIATPASMPSTITAA